MYTLLLLTALLCGLSGCSPDALSGGTSTSENGRIAGRIVTTEGAAAARTQVFLYPADYNPTVPDTGIPVDTTDASGYFFFSKIRRGTYAVGAVGISARLRSHHGDIAVDNDTVELTNDTLKKPGVIKIALPATADTSSGYVYIPGTNVSVKLSGSTPLYALLDSVPAGTITSVVYTSADTSIASLLKEEVTVHPADTTTVLTTGWKFHGTLFLNTTKSGADLSENLYRFPVLVRLTPSNFDFSQARHDGADILFTRNDGSTIPCEFEQWNSTACRAELWIHIDTIYRNNIDSGIVMYWGNPRALKAPSAAAVFDTAAGFSAVWHLGESADTLHDATVNRYHGIRVGSMKSGECIIGNGQVFDSSAGYGDMGNVLDAESASFTISAWVKRGTDGIETIIAKSEGGSPSSAYGWSLSFHMTDQLHGFMASGGSSWGAVGAYDYWSKEDRTVTDTSTWHFVAAVVDRSDSNRCRLYLDGADVTGGYSGNITGVGALVNSAALRIGAESDGEYQWAGSIDECIISHTVRSESWLKLCYSNQGTGDLLMTLIRE